MTAACGRSWTRWPRTAWCTGSRTPPGRAAWPGTGTGSRSTSSASSATGRSRAVEDVLSARIRDANLSRLVFSDILEDLRALAAAASAHDGEQVYRRLSRLDTVLDDMSRRAAQFHLTLGEIMRSTDTSPDTFLRYKNALLTHMTDFMAELDRYLPRLAAAVDKPRTRRVRTGRTRCSRLAAEADERPFLGRDELLDDWRRRWAALRAWFAARSGRHGRGRRVPRRGPAHRDPRRRLRRHRAAPPGHRGAARRGEPLLPAPPPRRVGVQHARRGRRLRADVGRVQHQRRRATSAARTTTPSRSPAARPGGTRPAWRSRSRCSGAARRRRPGVPQPARANPVVRADAPPPPGRASAQAERDAAAAPPAVRARMTGCSTTRRPESCSACSRWPPRPARSLPGA